MKIENKLEVWASVLGFAYDNLSGSDFDYLLEQSPFERFQAGGLEDLEEWCKHEPFEAHKMTTNLYFQ